MFLKNMSSFFMRDGEIRFVRVLIALLSGQLALFCLGALFYFSYSKLAIPLNIYFDFFYSEVLKNGIIMSTLFYGVIFYIFVVRYNKATIHSHGINNPKNLVFTLFAFIFYSFYMLFDSGVFTFDNEIFFIKDHYYFYIIFLMAIVNMANSFSILMLISSGSSRSSNINEKELFKVPGVIIDSFKRVYGFFVFASLFFIIANSMAISFSFDYYINIFITVIMIILFIVTLVKTLESVENRLKKSFSEINEEYKNIIKKNLNSVEIFKKSGVIDKLTISKVSISHSSVRYVVDDIKKIGDYEQIFLARYTDDHNILSAYFDKEGNLLAEDARKKET